MELPKSIEYSSKMFILGDTNLFHPIFNCLVKESKLFRGEVVKSKNIPIIGLNYKDEEEDAISWITRFGDPYKYIIHDYKGNLALDLGVTGAPETFLLNDGKIIVHYRGEVNDMIWNDVFKPIIKRENLFNVN